MDTSLLLKSSKTETPPETPWWVHDLRALRTVAVWILGLFLLAGFVNALGVGQPKTKDWTGHVYPDANNLERSHALGTFDSLDACRDEATSRLRALGAGSSGDYECGFKCRPMFPELGDESVRVCERTEH